METGHAIYVANFARLIQCVTDFGPDYSPANTAIAISALSTKHTDGVDALKLVHTNEIPYDEKVNPHCNLRA